MIADVPARSTWGFSSRDTAWSSNNSSTRPLSPVIAAVARAVAPHGDDGDEAMMTWILMVNIGELHEYHEFQRMLSEVECDVFGF